MRSLEINPEHIMTEVYSYPFPEVREQVDGFRLPARFMLNTIGVSEAQPLVDGYNFQPALELPAASDGALNLDELHRPVIDRLRTVVGEHMPGLDGFENTYPTPGSSQAMFTIMAEWRARGALQSIATLEGEYDGYTAYAEALQIPVTHHTSLEDHEPKPGEVWFVSNPSAVDGNWLDKDTWKKFTEAGHKIVYDAAYVGLTKDGTVDVSSPNIKVVLTSPSKLFGVFRYRNTGVAYTREPVAAMYGTKWFKDVPALLDTLKLYELYGHNELVEHYKPVQERICAALSELACADIRPSDVLLLGHSQEQLGMEYGKFERRPGTYRFGLTKLFEDME